VDSDCSRKKGVRLHGLTTSSRNFGLYYRCQLHRGDYMTVVMFVEKLEYLYFCTLPNPEIRTNERKGDCHFPFLRQL
jgi:hypothetical protein